ncbi:hypothetical protein SBRY_50204 [Actinacidiphila bryophytorum]|uniref:Twin-arginine translocation signal domain-containing protein n=1 Tax=Actinacidiphila bryophytorum TaxID=1436133 RepID=A0A9W4H3Y0_9ACTN|nr:hypothetical protein SBRY_50204 [Actinacidiphila bryophytorum]
MHVIRDRVVPTSGEPAMATVDRRRFLQLAGATAAASVLTGSVTRAAAIPAVQGTGTIRDVETPAACPVTRQAPTGSGRACRCWSCPPGAPAAGCARRRTTTPRSCSSSRSASACTTRTSRPGAARSAAT